LPKKRSHPAFNFTVIRLAVLALDETRQTNGDVEAFADLGFHQRSRIDQLRKELLFGFCSVIGIELPDQKLANRNEESNAHRHDQPPSGGGSFEQAREYGRYRHEGVRFLLSSGFSIVPNGSVYQIAIRPPDPSTRAPPTSATINSPMNP